MYNNNDDDYIPVSNSNSAIDYSDDYFRLDSPELDRYDDARRDIVESVEKEIERIELNIINCRDSYLLDNDDGTCNIDRLEDELDLLKMELYALEQYYLKENICD
jgi:hypothetical protein